jgi:hypothetical protein
VLPACLQVFSTASDNILANPEYNEMARLFLNNSVPILQRGYSCVPSDGANLTGMDFYVSSHTDRCLSHTYIHGLTHLPSYHTDV